MTLRNIVKEMRDGIGSMSRRSTDGKQTSRRRGRSSYIAPEGTGALAAPVAENEEEGQWANLPPELLHDIIQMIESNRTAWPGRRDVVVCASVCKSWRAVTKELIRTPESCGLLTFPVSLKQPGPRENSIQCFIRRERSTGTYRLYLGLTPALSGDVSKLLLAARKVRKATSTDFVISLVGNDFSRTSNNYVGKLRSNFLGTRFTIFDGQSPCNAAAIQSNPKSNRRTHVKQGSIGMPVSNYNIASISYELNVLRTRGPRRMQCTIHSIPISAIQEGGSAPTPMEFSNRLNEQLPPSSVPKGKMPLVDFNCTNLELPESVQKDKQPLVLKNKAPRWHEQLQCWCLNFKGRVTVASVKNFQLVAAADASQNIPAAEQEKVILQFGKIGKDIFTMDYRYPLSAFQAFAICLSSFDTKPACE